jgi:uncharacterized membrane protein
MAERTEGSITIGASAAQVMDVIADFEGYPEWAGVKSARVVKKDRKGRAGEVEFEVSAPLVGEVLYTLSYHYLPDDAGVSWTTKEIEGNIRDIQGEYLLDELDEDETKVTYSMTLDLALKVPGFLRRQGEKQIVKTALDGLKKRVESP